MPRPNRPRTTDAESNLARRIAYERGRLDLSSDALAKRMTELGCAINGSAIRKIESGDPPRHISVDEFTTLAKVFNTEPMELLRPPAAVRQERADELSRRLPEVWPAFDYATELAIATMQEYARLATEEAELREYIASHIDAFMARRGEVAQPAVFRRLIGEHVSAFEAWNAYEDLQAVIRTIERLAVASTGLKLDFDPLDDGDDEG